MLTVIKNNTTDCTELLCLFQQMLLLPHCVTTVASLLGSSCVTLSPQSKHLTIIFHFMDPEESFPHVQNSRNYSLDPILSKMNSLHSARRHFDTLPTFIACVSHNGLPFLPNSSTSIQSPSLSLSRCKHFP